MVVVGSAVVVFEVSVVVVAPIVVVVRASMVVLRPAVVDCVTAVVDVGAAVVVVSTAEVGVVAAGGCVGTMTSVIIKWIVRFSILIDPMVFYRIPLYLNLINCTVAKNGVQL